MIKAQTKKTTDLVVNDESLFRMIDVGRKRVTRRRAVAEGIITVGATAYEKIISKTLPKG